jgi:hypothetical protein
MNTTPFNIPSNFGNSILYQFQRESCNVENKNQNLLNEKFNDLTLQKEIHTRQNINHFTNIKHDLQELNKDNVKQTNDISIELINLQKGLSNQSANYFNNIQQNLIGVENSLGKLYDNHFQIMNKQAIENTNDLKINLHKAESNLSLQNINNTSTIKLEGIKAKNEILDKMKECCCEIQNKIDKSTCSIKELIKETDNTRLKDILRNYEVKNLLMEMKQCPLPPHYQIQPKLCCKTDTTTDCTNSDSSSSSSNSDSKSFENCHGNHYHNSHKN